MTNGLILLVFIAALVAFGWIRLRRRMGMGVTAKMFFGFTAAFAVAVLALWAYTTK